MSARRRATSAAGGALGTGSLALPNFQRSCIT
jgi:hypothetical protein